MSLAPCAVFIREERGHSGHSGKVFMEDKKLDINFHFNCHRLLLTWRVESVSIFERSELGERRKVTGL